MKVTVSEVPSLGHSKIRENLIHLKKLPVQRLDFKGVFFREIYVDYCKEHDLRQTFPCWTHKECTIQKLRSVLLIESLSMPYIGIFLFRWEAQFTFLSRTSQPTAKIHLFAFFTFLPHVHGQHQLIHIQNFLTSIWILKNL